MFFTKRIIYQNLFPLFLTSFSTPCPFPSYPSELPLFLLDAFHDLPSFGAFSLIAGCTSQPPFHRQLLSSCILHLTFSPPSAPPLSLHTEFHYLPYFGVSPLHTAHHNFPSFCTSSLPAYFPSQSRLRQCSREQLDSAGIVAAWQYCDSLE